MEDLYRFKLVLFGNERVGKTSLVDRYVNDKFEKDYISTLGYNVFEKRIIHRNCEISLMIYDIGGQEKFRQLRKKYAEGANTALILYDITNRESFENIPNWHSDLLEFSGDIPFIIIGNKVDLEGERKVSYDEAVTLSSKLGAQDFFETSAKTGEGVENCFQKLAIDTYFCYVE